MTGPVIQVRQLVVFVEVARAGSLLGASRALGVSQPVVSRAVRELEQRLGVPLFERGATGVTLTRYGESFLGRASGALAEIRAGVSDLQSLSLAQQARVVAGAMPAAATRLVPLAVARLKASRPGVLVEVIEGTNEMLVPLVLAGDVDVIVGRPMPADRMLGLSHEPLYYERLALAVRAAHPVLSQAPAGLADLMTWPWLVPVRGSSIRLRTEELFHAAGLRLPENRVESVSAAFLRGYALESDAIVVAPYNVVRQDIAAGTLAEIPLDLASTFGSIGITRRAEGTLSQPAEALLRHLRRAAATLRQQSASGVVREL